MDDEDYAISYDMYSLYYWNKGTETLVAQDVSDNYIASSSKAGAVIYNKYNDSSVEKLVMSELSSEGSDFYYSADFYIYEIHDKVRAARNLSENVNIAIGEKESTIDCVNAKYWSFNREGILFFMDDYNLEKGYGNLMSASIKNGTIEKPVKIDEDVSEYVFGNDNNNIYYYKDVKNNSGDLYLNGKLLASDVNLESMYNYKGKDKIIYLKDYSNSSYSGTLCVYDNGKETKISDDVSFYVPIGEKNIAFLVDYRQDRNKGDLMLYNGKKKPITIDTDVTMLLWDLKMLDSDYLWHLLYY